MARPELPRVGTELEVRAERVAHGGFVVGRAAGLAVFIRHALPGELVRVLVTEHGKGFVRADAIEVLTPHAERVEPRCAAAGPGGCGGCDWQHASRDLQRELKTSVVREAMTRFAGVTLPDDFVVAQVDAGGGSDGFRWRTRVSYAVGPDGKAGLRRSRSRDIVKVQTCHIAAAGVEQQDVLGRSWPGEESVLAVAPSGAEPYVVAESAARDAPTTFEVCGDIVFEVAADGFWQVHPAAAATLVAAVRDGLTPQPGEQVLDLYSGVGLFGLSLAADVAPGGHITMIEGNRRATELAVRNADACEATNLDSGSVTTRVLAGDVGLLADDAKAARLGLAGHSDVVVLDPPRSGAGKGVVRAIAALRPRAIAYVACDPVALARDLAWFRDCGYHLKSLQAWDFFPQTHHLECCAILRP